MKYLIVFLLFSGSLSAQTPKGVWPIDVEQNRRLDDHDKQLDAINTKLGLIAPEKEKVGTVCPCQGSAKATCLCLQKGLPCKCSAGVGSVWNVDVEKQVATAKTGQYADPTTLKLIPSSSLKPPQPAHAATAQALPTHIVVCNGRRCRSIRVR